MLINHKKKKQPNILNKKFLPVFLNLLIVNSSIISYSLFIALSIKKYQYTKIFKVLILKRKELDSQERNVKSMDKNFSSRGIWEEFQLYV